MSNVLTKKYYTMGGNYMKKKKENEIKIFMSDKNLTEEEIKLLKKQGKFTKCPYYPPNEQQYPITYCCW